MNASAQVNNFATAVYHLTSGPGTLSGGGTSYTVDFGTMIVNQPSRTLTLSLGNEAAGPADSLAGSFVLNPGNYQLSNFSNFTGLLTGQSLNTLSIGFNPNQVGTFTGTITLSPRSQNSSGFDGPLSSIVMDVSGVVLVPEPSSAILAGLGALALAARRRRASR